MTSFAAILAILLVAPWVARADSKPDFDDDAKPILRAQPGLLQYVEQHFEVKDTGTSKYPGDDDHRPSPPYIFRARVAGSNGPFNLFLLIQPGPVGHILNVVDNSKSHQMAPGAPMTAPRQSFASQQPPPQQQKPAQVPVHHQAPAPAPTTAPVAENPSSEPTADTPSGPIMGNDSGASNNTPQPSLAPPPDPAPSAQ